MELICSLLCSSLCCILFFGAIAGGIFFLLRQSKASQETKGTEQLANDDEPSESIEDSISPEEETAKVDAVVPPASEEESVSAEASPSPEAPAPVPPSSPKAAGQTIIAFDDDDEDF